MEPPNSGKYLVGLLVFTREQLSRFNGVEEPRRLASHNGAIFDVTDLES
jgi:predicted heme/steroid binding protein